MTDRGSAPPPPGYGRERLDDMEIVAMSEVIPCVRQAVSEGSLYSYAASHAERALQGRVPAYVVPLPAGGPTVVVRHSHHGGLLAPLTRDRFLGPTRAPHELAMSIRLATMGIHTPPLAAYVVYGGPFMRRSDVATLLIEGGSDLAESLGGSAAPEVRTRAIAAACALLASMARTGVRHRDLNLKNILIASRSPTTRAAYLLDIDRVDIEPRRALAAAANAARLVRSAVKWRERRGAPISDAEIAMLEAAALGQAP